MGSATRRPVGEGLLAQTVREALKLREAMKADPAERKAYINAYQRGWAKRRRDRWKAAGLCPECGRERSKFVLCLFCRWQDAKAHHRRRKRKART